ncbi:hypothetical protein HPP92_029093 [Vanilla planifolia]|uniref:Uncharacterized protein n=1 Tax=Vanilla planifolia TaxID=51239 RepID=A0A835U4L6_VANPL|nr:hypothetical protein HPP92_029093 [Vanilla planifolia]KAG0445931.1 hypothetical protein HPP92_029082 [Vanilla planifolia]
MMLQQSDPPAMIRKGKKAIRGQHLLKCDKDAETIPTSIRYLRKLRRASTNMGWIADQRANRHHYDDNGWRTN